MVGRFYPVGIMIGFTAGLIATVVLGALAGIVLGLVGVDLSRNLSESTAFSVAILLVTSVGFVVSGFVTAEYSPGHRAYNVGATGFVLVIASTAGFSSAETVILPFWLNGALL